jgi:AraC-like DNA-binding protein
MLAMDSKHPSFPPPPPWAQRFRSDDLEEIGQFVSRRADQHARVPHGRGSMNFEQSWVAGTSLLAGWIQSGLGMTVRGAVRDPVLHVAVPEGTEYRFGRRSRSTGRHAVTFVPPSWEYTVSRRAGAVMAVAVSQNRLAEEIVAREPDRRGELLLLARSVDLDAPSHARLFARIADFVVATTPDTSPGQLVHAEAKLIGSLAELLLDQSATGRAKEISASRLAELEAWVEAHLEEPISLARLCNLAGVGERALQKAFESRRGMSPMRFVAERRLAAARRLLTRASPRDDVTHIAIKLGFGHTGRFAVLYRQTFGESPSQSRQRATRLGPLAS